MFKLDLEKAEEPEIKLPTAAGSQKNQGKKKKEKPREFQKNIYFYVIGYAKAFDCVDHNKLWKTVTVMGIPDHLTCLLRSLYADQEATVRTGLDMEQRTGSKSRKEYVKAAYCHPAYLTYMQNTSCEMPDWMKHSWNQDCWEKYQ